MSKRVVCLDPLIGILHLAGSVHATTQCGIDFNVTGATVTFGPEHAIAPHARERCAICFGWTCPRCGMTSHHPLDALEGYCSNCHDWTGGLGRHFGHHDRKGQRITMRRWAELREDPEYRRVAHTEVEGLEVSTVLLSIDHSYTDGPPIIFETMVFDGEGDNPRTDIYCERYATEEAALAGHDRAVEWAKDVAAGRWPNGAE